MIVHPMREPREFHGPSLKFMDARSESHGNTNTVHPYASLMGDPWETDESSMGQHYLYNPWGLGSPWDHNESPMGDPWETHGPAPCAINLWGSKGRPIEVSTSMADESRYGAHDMIRQRNQRVLQLRVVDRLATGACQRTVGERPASPRLMEGAAHTTISHPVRFPPSPTTPFLISQPSKLSGPSSRQGGEGSYPPEAGGAARSPPTTVVGPALVGYQGRRLEGGALVKATTSAATRGTGGAGGPAGGERGATYQSQQQQKRALEEKAGERCEVGAGQQ